MFFLIRQTLWLRKRAQPVDAVNETIIVYCESHTKYTNTLSEHNAEILVC
jgi:hypothetical protein